jgi:outer membrane protein
LRQPPFEHTAAGKGAIQGVDLADFKHLPPTLSGIYRFTPISGFLPYVGAALNYTLIFDEELTPQAKTTFVGLGLTGGKVDVENSIDLSVQAGVDYHIDESWLISASGLWIGSDTDAEIRFDSGDRLASSIEVDPWMYTASVGMKS